MSENKNYFGRGLILLIGLFLMAVTNVTVAENAQSGPAAVINPTQLNFTLNPTDQPVSQSCAISNTGTEPLSFQITGIQTVNPLAASIQTESVKPALQPEYNQPFVLGRIIVGLKVGEAQTADVDLFDKIGALSIRPLAIARNPQTGIKAFDRRQLLLVTIANKSRQGVIDAIGKLLTDPHVQYVEPDYMVHALETIPNDPDFTKLYALKNIGQNGGTPGCDIDATDAWDRIIGNDQVIIGVIDSGIDYNHPDLKDNIWTNPNEVPNNGIDDDHNGYIDDIHGWDFYNKDKDPMDDYYHGTHCAGTIAAVGNNNIGITGVCWKAKLAALKFLDNTGNGSDSDAIDAIAYAKAMGFPITSNSWGGSDYSQAMRDVIAEGGLFVASAGNSTNNNDAYPTYPASFDCENIIAVAATDEKDQLASFSNYGATSVDLAAPGVRIWSCQPGSGYRFSSGTSMAGPHVTGAAALLKSYNMLLTSKQLKDAILKAVDIVPALHGKVLTNGRLNLNKALNQITPPWITVTPKSGAVAPGGTQNLTVTINPEGMQSGQWQGEIAVQTNDPAHPQLTIKVNVNINKYRSLNVQPQSYDFGDVWLGKSSLTTIRLLNNGNDGVTVSSITSNNNEFTPIVSTPITIPAKSSVAVELKFSPASTGSKNAKLTIVSDAQDNPTLTMNLSGRGLTPSVSLDPVGFNETIPNGTSVTRTLTLKNNTSLVTDFSIARLNNLNTTAAGGPDKFGYRWSDSDQSDGPVFAWQEISTTGKILSQAQGDDAIAPINLSFPFTFYGKTFNTVYVSSNGFLTFSPNGMNPYLNNALPSAFTPPYTIAGFFDDLFPNRQGNIYYLDDGNKLIVEYKNVELNPGSVTFQIVLDKNGTITYYYQSMTGTLTSATVGIQNGTQNDGLNIAYNQSYIKDNFAVRISTAPGWLKISPEQGNIPAGGSTQINVTFDSIGLASGRYHGTLDIQSTSGFHSQVPCTLNVSEVKKLDATPKNIDFGNVLVGETKTVELTLTNSGSVATTINQISFGNGEFSCDLANPAIIPAGGSRKVNVLFKPVTVGPKTTTLTLVSDAQDNPTLSINLTGLGSSADINVSPLSFSESLSGGASVTRMLTIQNNSLVAVNYQIKQVTANVGGYGTGGPDQFGYRWIDSKEAGGPQFTWQEISQTGTRLIQADGDDAIQAVNLSFAFPFYERSFTTAYISSNGFITFGSSAMNPYLNYQLPNRWAPPYLLAAFYDDLFPNRQGDIYFYDDGNKAIVEYKNVANDSGTVTFQIVLDKNGTVTYYYQNMTGVLTSATVGIQNGTQNDGLNIVYNRVYVENNLAVRIWTKPNWLNMNPEQGAIPAGGTGQIALTFDSAGLSPGTYNVNLELTLSGKSTPLIIPCTLEVK